MVSPIPKLDPPLTTSIRYDEPDSVTVIDQVPPGAVPPDVLVTTTPDVALVTVYGPPVPLVASPLVILRVANALPAEVFPAVPAGGTEKLVITPPLTPPIVIVISFAVVAPPTEVPRIRIVLEPAVEE
jgi:hypothetical protein